MRTVFVQAGLGAGGAEKIVNMLAHHRDRCGDKVDVIALNADDTRSFFPYAPTIGVHALRQQSGPPVVKAALRLWRLRRLIRSLEPQLVLSFLTKVNVITGIATIGIGTRAIMSERNNLRVQKMNPAWRILAKLSARRAAGIVMQTEQARACLPRDLQRRAVVIPNPVTSSLRERRPPEDACRFVAVGRLDSQKGFDLLLEAFATVARRVPAASLVIFGEGRERDALQRQARDLGIADRVDMPGVTKSPQEWLEAGSVFVLSSRFEGFPNVLLEALIGGMPVVAFDCPWGPAEILRDEKDYDLVPAADVDALAEALIRVVCEPDVKRKLEHLGPVLAERYTPRAIFEKWDRLIGEAVSS